MRLREATFIVTSVKKHWKESAVSPPLNECSLILGSVLLIPKAYQGSGLEQRMRQHGLHIIAPHPQFSPEETTSLLAEGFVRIKQRIEGLLQALDGCIIVEESRYKLLVEEVKWLKAVVSSSWPHETCDEVKRLNDLADVLLSRVIELSKIHVVRSEKIEN